ncbi:hypothetical protein NPW74_004848 [Escherichia coli]|nr:hypothetical protein [Escherichia coli]
MYAHHHLLSATGWQIYPYYGEIPIEDYIFINFMLKSEYINKAQYDAYMVLWSRINELLTEPDIIAFINYPIAHSLMHLNDDEIYGVRPEEFPDEEMNIKWITGWHAEYQHFTDNLPLHRKRSVCDVL